MDNVVIDDLCSVVSDNDAKGKSKVDNNFGMSKKRKKSLNDLKENARKGDRISSKIYRHLCENAPEVISKEKLSDMI